MIRRILPTFDTLDPRIVIGPGDDAAVVACVEGRHAVYTTDLLIEGIHFLTDWIRPEELGHKAAAVNLSDLAAMGATPDWLLIAIACPASTDMALLESFFEGLRRYAAGNNVRILGGDTCRADRLMLSVTAVGSLPAGREVSLSKAKENETVYVTGEPGLSALGLLALKQWGRRRAEADFPAAVRAHLKPEPPLRVAELLAERVRPGAMTDVSDGLARDLGKICQASTVGARIDFSLISWHPEMCRGVDELGAKPEQLALTGGEDYSLLFTAPKDRLERHRVALEEALQGVPCREVGQVLPRNQGYFARLSNGETMQIDPDGFDHFK